jgi:hypothetical protein
MLCWQVREVATTSEQAMAPTTVDGERKMISALFADIKGSTKLIRDLDPEEARAVIDPVLHLMMDAVHRHDGYLVQSAGDGIFPLFSAPVAHEDHAQRAVHAAIAMRDALRRRAGDLPGRPAPEVRIAINTDEVVLRLIRTGGHTECAPPTISLGFFLSFPCAGRARLTAKNSIWFTGARSGKREMPSGRWIIHRSTFALLVRVANREKPGLTIVIDDYSSAVAGYLLSIEAPPTLHTSLALR